MPQENFLNEKQQLEKQIQKLQRKMRTLRNRQRRPVINSIVKSMQEYDISLDELAKVLERRTQTTAPTSSAAARSLTPETQPTWTGRGRPPRWIVDAEAKGQSRDSFLIKAE